MHILEHGQGQPRTLLFLPCTAEPVWAFEDTIALLALEWHVFQVVYDGHQPEYPGDFTSVEQTVDEVTDDLESRGTARLDAAYGCSLGGACLTRLLALGKMPVGRAIIDGGITTLSAALCHTKAAAGARCALLQACGKQPQNSGGGVSAGTVYAARARPRKGVRRHRALSANLL